MSSKRPRRERRWRENCHPPDVDEPTSDTGKNSLGTASPLPNKDHTFLQRNGLSLAFAVLSLISVVGHAFAGFRVDQADRLEHHEKLVSPLDYLGSGAFVSSLLENWEIEFLQIAVFVVLTVFLRQKGSSESRPFVDPPDETYPLQASPWPVRRGGVWLQLYEHSLSVALFALFGVCFVGHLFASWRHHHQDLVRHGQVGPTLAEHLTSSEFWFESLQNWQSEFVSITALVLLSIYLREKDSSQSKDVAAPHSHTGE